MATYNIYQVAPDKLGRVWWRLLVTDGLMSADPSQIRVRLTGWANQTRPTTRHKWQGNGDAFDAYAQQGSRARAATPPEPPVEVFDELRRRITSALTYAGPLR